MLYKHKDNNKATQKTSVNVLLPIQKAGKKVNKVLMCFIPVSKLSVTFL